MSDKEWRVAPGFPMYAVSDAGDVFNYATMQYERMDRSGRLHVRRGRNEIVLPVGVFVCNAWHGPPPTEQSKVMYRDGDVNNTTPSNVYWREPHSRVEQATVDEFDPKQDTPQFLSPQIEEDIKKQYVDITRGRTRAPNGWRKWMAKRYGVDVNVISRIIRSYQDDET